ncbi:MAG: hypothetical protein P4L50_10735 [Anaerolineaceae bacterium]|nr:hypothetical protein [Anaerolineaceae bacterium]
MLKIIARILLVLLIAAQISGDLFVFAKSNTAHLWLGLGTINPPATTSGSQGSGAANVNSSSGSQSSSDYHPNTLMDVLQKLFTILEFSVGVFILRKILSLFIKKPGIGRTSRAAN